MPRLAAGHQDQRYTFNDGFSVSPKPAENRMDGRCESYTEARSLLYFSGSLERILKGIRRKSEGNDRMAKLMEGF